MTGNERCVECGKPAVDWHHIIPKSEGGTEVEPRCKKCHVHHHSANGDFARWGRMGGQKTAQDPRHWMRNLKQYRASPSAASDAALLN